MKPKKEALKKMNPGNKSAPQGLLMILGVSDR